MASNQDEGRRQALLEKQRAQMMQDIQRQKDSLAATTAKTSAAPSDRFTTRTEGLDEALKKSTIGLVTLDEFRKTKSEIEEARRREAAQMVGVGGERDKEPKQKKAKKKERSKLSFGDDEEEEGEDGVGDGDGGGGKVNGKKKRVNGDMDGEAAPTKKPKFTKNPEVDTSFLPDRDRESRERLEREQLRKEWLEKQEKIKAEGIEITYSYWDGSGHRKSVECKKGDDIATFLGKCREQFPELRGISVENLMYIKEDLIIPHHYTFYDFIVNKARGKSGPLFSFDVHDDVRLIHDASKEKDESHAGKVVERSWYQRSKHIFPASRWEVYDPDKDYGAYKIA